MNQADITVDECIELATTAKAMAPKQPQCWDDLIDLSTSLAPAIGLQRAVIHEAEKHLGRHGCALAILGLVEAFGRIRNPEAYLTALVQRRLKQGLDLVRMFRSLVRPGKPTAAFA
jgi:replication initiation protein RepC